MLKLEQAVLVEGKYDAARLTNLVDATILTTDGSRVFRDKELQNMLKRIAAAQGLIILTDSDDAGFRIRHFVTGLVGAEHVLQAYVPAVHGKEARKQAPGKLLLNDAVTIPGIEIPQVPIIKGDAKSISIGAASIVAKVTRDRLMVEYDRIMPEYDFASNKGYGSAEHIAALKKYGPTPIHRASFIKNFV